ncbi:hypothetical protein [Campylobacter majalis]|uniref:hypothetical protein n=1 Tax=Campylobacter majalis TaxID=2790656 RepID=UPI003D6969DA
MKIPFTKISTNTLDFDIEKDGLKFHGILKRKTNTLVLCNAKILGTTTHICDRCGIDIRLTLSENVDLMLSDGVYKDCENELGDVVEFFDGCIDLNEILISEVEAYNSDYFYCDSCKDIDKNL